MLTRNPVIESNITAKSPIFGVKSPLWLVRKTSPLYHRKWFWVSLQVMLGQL